MPFRAHLRTPSRKKFAQVAWKIAKNKKQKTRQESRERNAGKTGEKRWLLATRARPAAGRVGVGIGSFTLSRTACDANPQLNQVRNGPRGVDVLGRRLLTSALASDHSLLSLSLLKQSVCFSRNLQSDIRSAAQKCTPPTSKPPYPSTNHVSTPDMCCSWPKYHFRPSDTVLAAH